MAGYGDIVTGTQEFYSDFSEASRSVSEATGSYFGKMREQKAKEGRWNQTLDAGFSLFKGYQEGAQEHADAANVAKEAGFEYKQPDTLWDTWKGVDDKASFSRIEGPGKNYGKSQTITGSDLKNMSNLYKVGGMKAVGDTQDYGTWKETGGKDFKPESSFGVSSKDVSPYENTGINKQPEILGMGRESTGSPAQDKINVFMKQSEGHDARLREKYDTNEMDDMGITYGKTSIAKQLAGGDDIWQSLLDQRELWGKK